MSTATKEKEGREVKLKTGFVNPKQTGKEFTFGELEGLKQVFSRLEASNPKRSGKVDYWLAQNHKAIGEAWDKYMAEEWDLLKVHAEILERDGAEYLVHKGADDTDLMYFHGGAMFKLVNDKFEFVHQPHWKLTVTPAEEGKDAVTKDMQYRIKYKTDKAEEDFNAALIKLREDYRFNIEIWPLKEENLEGMSVVWKDIRNGQDGKPYVESDATVFRNLLYDNCIIP